MKRDTKEAIQYGSAIGMLILGSALAIAGFIMSHGEIHDSVLWLFAQCLLYAGMTLEQCDRYTLSFGTRGWR